MPNLLFVGVGGQGVLLASDVATEVAFRAGFDAKKSEVHGMSQRGGSVFSHLRFGERVHSPLIPQGEADFLISFEAMETLRWTRYSRRDTLVIVSRLQIPPVTVARGEAEYPQDIVGLLRESYKHVVPVDARSVAEGLGEPRTANTVLLGCLAVHLDLPVPLWREALADLVPPHTVDVNLQAFEKGWSLAAEGKK